MYSEEQKDRALRTYHHLGSVTATVRRLGYPSRAYMYEWIRNEEKTKGQRKKLNLMFTGYIAQSNIESSVSLLSGDRKPQIRF